MISIDKNTQEICDKYYLESINFGKKYVFNKIIQENIMTDEFIIREADKISWQDFVINHGVTPKVYKRFKKDIDDVLDRKLGVIKSREEFLCKYKFILDNIKQMFPCVSGSIQQFHKHLNSFIVTNETWLKLIITLDNLTDFFLVLILEINDDDNINVRLASTNRYQTVLNPDYYQSSNFTYDFKLFHYLKYFKSLTPIEPTHHYQNIDYVKNQVNKTTGEWLKNKLSEEHEMSKMINEMKIKGIKF